MGRKTFSVVADFTDGGPLDAPHETTSLLFGRGGGWCIGRFTGDTLGLRVGGIVVALQVHAQLVLTPSSEEENSFMCSRFMRDGACADLVPCCSRYSAFSSVFFTPVFSVEESAEFSFRALWANLLERACTPKVVVTNTSDRWSTWSIWT